jgi:hypothetical protein
MSSGAHPIQPIRVHLVLPNGSGIMEQTQLAASYG